jgi:hypothetical protein
VELSNERKWQDVFTMSPVMVDIRPEMKMWRPAVDAICHVARRSSPAHPDSGGLLPTLRHALPAAPLNLACLAPPPCPRLLQSLWPSHPPESGILRPKSPQFKACHNRRILRPMVYPAKNYFRRVLITRVGVDIARLLHQHIQRLRNT